MKSVHDHLGPPPWRCKICGSRKHAVDEEAAQLAGSRFYAVITAGRMECPSCGHLNTWDSRSHSREGEQSSRYWDAVSSRLRCRKCRKVFSLGLIAWSDHTQAGDLPPDQVGEIRQLAELRQRAGGIWPKRRRKRREAVNRFVAEGCCCAPLAWRAECPVHGQLGIVEEKEQKL